MILEPPYRLAKGPTITIFFTSPGPHTLTHPLVVSCELHSIHMQIGYAVLILLGCAPK